MMRPGRWLLLLALLPTAVGSFSRAPLPDGVERQVLYPGGTRVLIIGLSEYRDRQWPKLNGRRDAERIQRLFLERGVPAAAITLIEPDADHGPALQDALVRFGESLPSDAQAQSRVVVYIAGHGFTADGLGYLVPPDAPDPVSHPAEFKLAALPLSSLLARVAEFRASQVLLILDACFSGLALESLPRERFPHPPSAVDAQGKILQVITAGAAGQTVADDGVFAELIASGLTGAADLNMDGWISGTELGMYLRLRMTERTDRRQTPSFGNVLGLSRDYRIGENWFASAQLPLQSLTRPAQVLDHGTTAFRDCEDCPLLRVVPGAHVPSVESGAAYLAMGVREITFGEYDACYRAAGCTHWPWSPSGSRGPLPVTDVNRHDASEYTQWLSCITRSRYRLPSDDEWFAAAKQEIQRFARSKSPAERATANCRGCGSTWDGRETAPVGSFAPSELGLYDLVGNVWEWVADCKSLVSSVGGCAQGLVRGGAFTTRRNVAITLPSGTLPAATRERNIGFRVVRDLEGVAPVTRGSCAAEEPTGP
jgi:hypothetical protein